MFDLHKKKVLITGSTQGIGFAIAKCLSKAGATVFINGTNFTRWSEVYVNGEPVDTAYINNHMLAIQADQVQDGDTIVVNQMGSSNTIFRSSNTYRYASRKAIE